MRPGVEEGSENDLYEDNSGTTVSIKGSGYVIAAADTRNCGEFNINTRTSTKILPLCEYAVLTIAGSYADGRHVWTRLKQAVSSYEFDYGEKMDIPQMAAALHVILYQNRFFPKYTYCCVSGIDLSGDPRIYSFDPVGSYQETDCRCNGSGTKLLQPLLDSKITKNPRRDLVTFEESLVLVRDAFASAAETDVKTGDSIEIYVLRKGSVERELFPLRHD
jgi:20S proteasome subunit beta 6